MSVPGNEVAGKLYIEQHKASFESASPQRQNSMISGIYILLYFVALALSAPLIWAIVKLTSEPVHKALLSFVSRNALLKDSSRDTLESSLKQLRLKSIACKKLLNLSVYTEKEIEQKLASMSANETRANKNQIIDDDEANKITTEASRLKYKELLNSCLVEQAARTETLKQRTIELQDLIDSARTLGQAQDAQALADQVLAVYNSEEAYTMIARMELKVCERELQARKVHPAVPPKMSDADRQNIENLAAKIPNLRGFGTKVWDSITAVDPSIERGFKRLISRLERAQNLAVESREEESALNQLLTNYRTEVETTDRQLEEAREDSNASWEKILLQKKQHWFECAADLDEAVKLHSKRNLANDQLLFQIGGIVKRLLIVKTLLGALPRTKKEEIRQFKETVSAVCRLIAVSINNDERKASEPKTDDLLKRLSSLERSTLKTYISIAKGSILFSEKASANFAQKIEYATGVLGTERDELQLEYETWEKQTGTPTSETQAVPPLYATLRKEQCEAILKIVERSTDALKVAAKGAVPKPGTKSEAPA